LAKKPKRTLIIDDEESIRDGCQQILSRMGHEVVSTGDAEHGLQLALDNRFDIILLDERLPKIEGLEILRILKKEHNVTAKVVIITGYGRSPWRWKP
jgi:DNA-binding NtrC family response regulator